MPGVSYAEIVAKTYVDNVVQEKVTKTGDEEIAGVKTFNNTPLSVTPNVPTFDGSVTDGLVTSSNLSNAIAGTVKTSGNQAISGVKTFTQIPLVPTAPLPTRQFNE